MLRSFSVLLLAEIERPVWYICCHGVLHPDEPILQVTVLTVKPHELGGEGDAHAQHGSRDRLHLRGHADGGSASKHAFTLAPMDVEPKHRSDLLRRHVPQSLHRRFPSSNLYSVSGDSVVSNCLKVC